MECPAIVILLFGIMATQWSKATLSTTICIDQVSSFITMACNGCIQIALSSQYSDRK
ncbi:hypothetical protein LOAG_15666 [Loa loa]|uniref:Uncharacterized protein n=1 Tax=Loa loa TaxID=7209 RepID=A0A1S0TFC8_LOALO|nr:hypothetical protein LOAG_15666 [Loa loa]EFO12867.1 hypothetical protein LOAG_15666 [Loa loa]